MTENFVGKYSHTKSENFDEFLKSIQVPYIPRKMMGKSNPDVEVLQEGDEWIVKTITLIRTIEYKFKSGVEMLTDSMDGTKAKNIFTIEGNKIVQKQSSDKFTMECTREFTEDELIQTMKHVEADVTAVRRFARVKTA